MNSNRKSHEEDKTQHLDMALSEYLEVKLENREEYRSLVNSHLKRVYSPEKPFRILLTTFNNSQGIGDFAHQLDFTQKYQSVKSNPNIKSQSICFVTSDKISIIKLLMQDKNIGEVYYFNDNDKDTFDAKRAQQSNYIIWTKPSKEEGALNAYFSTLSKNARALSEYTNKYDSIINISTQQNESCQIGSLFSLLKNQFIQNINEYGIYPVLYYMQYEPSVKNYIDTTISMGVAASEAGIKIDEEIRRNVQFAEKLGKTGFYKKIGKIDICENLIPSKQIEAYFATHTIAYGYIQEHNYSYLFTKFVVTVSDKPNIDILTNTTTFKALKVAYLISKGLNFFKKQGIYSIELIDKNHKPIIISVNVKEEKGDKGKTLRIIDTSGISDTQKKKIIALADILSGSGDTSYTEVISAGKMSFLHSRPWKNCFFSGMIKNIQEVKSQVNLSVLEDYISYMMGFEENFSEIEEYRERGSTAGSKQISKKDFLEFVKKNKNELAEQFAYYADYLRKNKNVVSEQNNILNRSFVISILERGTNEEKQNILTLIRSWTIGHTNFLYYSAKHNNLALLRILYNTNKEQFLLLVDKIPYAHLQENKPKKIFVLACALCEEEYIKTLTDIYVKNGLVLSTEDAHECFAAICSRPDFVLSNLNYLFQLLNQPSAQKSAIVTPFVGTIIKNIDESNLVIFIKEFKLSAHIELSKKLELLKEYRASGTKINLLINNLVIEKDFSLIDFKNAHHYDNDTIWIFIELAISQYNLKPEILETLIKDLLLTQKKDILILWLSDLNLEEHPLTLLAQDKVIFTLLKAQPIFFREITRAYKKLEEYKLTNVESLKKQICASPANAEEIVNTYLTKDERAAAVLPQMTILGKQNAPSPPIVDENIFSSPYRLSF